MFTSPSDDSHPSFDWFDFHDAVFPSARGGRRLGERMTAASAVGDSAMPPGPPPGPMPIASANACGTGNVACVNTEVRDSEVVTAFGIYVVVAIGVLTIFGIVRHYIPIYTGRSHLRSLKANGCGPPEMGRDARRDGGWARALARHLYGWIPHVLGVSDAELVETAGLDALVFLRIAQFGTQLFAPLAFVGMCVLVPIHMSQTFVVSTMQNITTEVNVERKSERHILMDMTITNIEPKSYVMWIHVGAFWLITAYAIWLLNRHHRSYEFLRQVYGTTTGESNPWRAVHIPQTVLQKLLQQGMNANREFATDGGIPDASVRRTSQYCSPRGETPAAPTRTSIGDIKANQKVIPRNSGYKPFTTDSRPESVQRTCSASVDTDAGPSSVDDVAWPVLLEALLGPKRAEGAQQPMSTEQKLRQFPRASMVEAQTAGRGHNSHHVPRPSQSKSIPPRQAQHRPLPSIAPAKPTGKIRGTVPRSTHSQASSTQGPPSTISEISMAGMSDFNETDDTTVEASVVRDGANTSVNEEVTDSAINHEWWGGLDIALEFWKAELGGTRVAPRYSIDGHVPGAMLPPTRRLRVQIDPELGQTDPEASSITYVNSIPSIDDRRYISAITTDIDDSGAERDVAVSVLVQNYCILMTDVGGSNGGIDPWEDLRAVEKVFQGLFPEDFLMVIPLQDHRLVDDLLSERDRLCNKMERIGMVQRKRLGRTHGASVQESISSLRDRVTNIERLIVTERERILRTQPGPSCIVAFKTQYAAACVAQCQITSRRRDLFNIEPAPGPDNLNWQAVLLRRRQREIRAAMVFPLILGIIFIPTGTFTGVMSSLCVSNQFGTDRNVALTWYCSDNSARLLRVVVQGILPPILLTLWETFVVSFGMMYLVQAQNKYTSLSRTDESFANYYFIWAFINVFFGTVSGYAIQRYLNALNTRGPDEMLQLLGTSLPLTSNFFLLWIVFRGVYLPTQRLIFPHPGVLCMVVNRWLCCLGCAVTAHDRTIKYSPRSVRLGREVGVFSMVMMIGLVFATVAPLITLLCMVFFVFNFVIWRYHVLYVYERSYESGGTMWNTFTNLTIYALMIAQSFLSFVLLSKKAYAAALILWITVLPVLNKVGHRFRSLARELKWSVPLPQAAVAPRVEFNAEIYVHPALKRNSMGWHPEIGKVWRGYPNVTVKRAGFC